MNNLKAITPYITPFYALQYPTVTPQRTDSFHDSPYYNVGPLDFCIVISLIAAMAILRDAFRLLIFEPFARWKLMRDLRMKKDAKRLAAINASTNGHVANGNGNVVNGKEHSASNGHANGNGYTNGNGRTSANGNGHANGHVGSLNGYTPKDTSVPTAKELRALNRRVMRFAEQGWSVVYYPVQWAFGVYVHYHLPTKLLDPTDLWRDYPHIPLAAPVKFYYLTQSAFYLHQILIINAEARRKDHVQMMAHHIITVFLILGSYFTNFSRVGCVIMVLMDFCDIFLPSAKMLLYIQVKQIYCDLMFGWFMISWLVTRHVLFILVIYSTIFTAPHHIEFIWDWENRLFITRNAFDWFCASLVALQLIQIVWFWMICKVAWRVVTTEKGASDDRSDDEDGVSDPKED